MARTRKAGRRWPSAAWLLALGMLAVLALPAGGGLAQQPETGPYGDAPAAAKLDRFNAGMRQIYGRGRDAFAAAARPVIVVAGDDLILITADGTERRAFTPSSYHRLKAVSHLVLGLVGAVAPALHGLPTERHWRQELEAIAAAMDALEPALGASGLTAEEAMLTAEMLARSRVYVASAVQRETPDRAAFEELMAQIKPFWLTAANAAAQAQLEGLDKVVRDWQAMLSAQEWADLYVLVLGPRNPRVGNLQAAYFARLLGERVPGERVIYTESIFDPDQAMGLLAVLVMDRALSELVFGDPYRMEVDLLSSVAATTLDQLISGRSVPAVDAVPAATK